MRPLLIAVALAFTPPAIAQIARAPEPPTRSAPSSTATLDQREQWCARYAAWLIDRLPTQGETPADVRPTQRFENEMSTCRPDPQAYERQTASELEHEVESEAG